MAALGFLPCHARLHFFQFLFQRRVLGGVSTGFDFLVHRLLFGFSVRGIGRRCFFGRGRLFFAEGQEYGVVFREGQRPQPLHRRGHGPQHAHVPQVVAAGLRVARGIRRVERRRNMLVASGLHRFGKGGVHLPEIRLKPQADALQPGHPAHCRVVRLRMPDDQRGLMNRRVIGRGYGRKVRLAERDAPPVNGPVPSGPENGLAHSKKPPFFSGLPEGKRGVFERALEKANGQPGRKKGKAGMECQSPRPSHVFKNVFEQGLRRERGKARPSGRAEEKTRL